MTNRIKTKLILATLFAGLLGQDILATPAEAGGRFSWTYAPSDRDTAGALETGLRLYSLYNDLRGGSIRQKGEGNSAGLAQRGDGNVGLVEQRGNRNSGTLQQNGDRNTYGLFQFGRGTDDDIVQNGNGGSGTTFSYGW
ncbi:hypothetical protein [Aurantimonas sp. Leaf443]|uniref:hypothetical protein n=1 Tax=Aurantimonas sp. Leaf443 TaxID=1736378 RepID=UPI00070131D1|nr:hypothetical protein [Aurantimonas sp. Leaf443]KQT82763.1 curlin [Aurantimonas sp. Leaf443]